MFVVIYGVGIHPAVGVADVSCAIKFSGEGRPWCW